MNLLALDTSTEMASVALFFNGEMRHTVQGAARSHAQFILLIIESLLGEAGSSLHQLDGIVFGRGPGSFTGLRIACSIAKGLAYAHDLPVYPVSSLAAIAYEARQNNSNEDILALIDARMQQLYWALFPYHSKESCHAREGGHLIQERVSDAKNILIPNSAPLIVAGVGFEHYLPQLPKTFSIKKTLQIYPQAQNMIRLVLDGKIDATSAEKAEPIYVRDQVTQGDPRG